MAMSSVMTVCDRPTYPHRSPRLRRPLDEWRRKLAADYLPLAEGIVRSWSIQWPYLQDEFESVAQVAVVEAAEAFDPGRNVRFTTFAYHRVEGAMWDVQKREVLYGWRTGCREGRFKVPRKVRLCSEIHEPVGRVLVAEADDPIGWAVDSVDAVEAWLRKLPPQYAIAMRYIYIYGKSQFEVARAMGVSQSRVAQIHGEAKAMLNGAWDARVRREGA